MEDHLRRAAIKRVAEKKRFYHKLGSFLAFSVFFFVLDLITGGGLTWWFWPVLGWGIGIVSQYIKVFGLPGGGLGSHEWERRELDKELRRLAPEAPSDKKDDQLDLDKHLELKELETQKGYRGEDLV